MFEYLIAQAAAGNLFRAQAYLTGLLPTANAAGKFVFFGIGNGQIGTVPIGSCRLVPVNLDFEIDATSSGIEGTSANTDMSPFSIIVGSTGGAASALVASGDFDGGTYGTGTDQGCLISQGTSVALQNRVNASWMGRTTDPTPGAGNYFLDYLHPGKVYGTKFNIDFTRCPVILDNAGGNVSGIALRVGSLDAQVAVQLIRAEWTFLRLPA